MTFSPSTSMYLELREPGSFPKDSASPAPFSVRTRRFCDRKKPTLKKKIRFVTHTHLAASLCKLTLPPAGACRCQVKRHRSHLGNTKSTLPRCIFNLEKKKPFSHILLTLREQEGKKRRAVDRVGGA